MLFITAVGLCDVTTLMVGIESGVDVVLTDCRSLKGSCLSIHASIIFDKIDL